MRLALASSALLLGLLTFVGQLISVVDFELAQRLGLQEKSDHAGALFSRLEQNTARWDIAVLWTLVPVAVLMLVDHSWWPWLALATGGMHVDAGGRELAKFYGLRADGVAVGTQSEQRTFQLFLIAMSAIGAALIGYALAVLA
ncbi:MAG: hypothetical protein ACR2OD_11730 [Gaiellaceae bacterium]